MKTFRLALVLIAFVAATRESAAGMINFTFAGVDMSGSDEFYGTPTMGSGSFSFADGATSVNLNNLAFGPNNLAGFSFSDTTNYKTIGPTTFSYGFNDLNFFSATLTPSGTLTSLRLSTIQKESDNFFYYQSQAFIVMSLAASEAFSINLGHAGVLIGTVTPAAVPEPTSIVLCGLGLVGALAAGRRRSVAG